MDEYRHLVWAVDALRPELPDLVGADWPVLDAQLTPLLAEAEADPGRTPLVHAQILLLFAAHPAAHARLVELLALDGEDALEAIRGIAYAAPGPASLPPVREVVRYTDIACPQRIWAQAPRITAVVRLTLAPRDGSAATEALTLREDLPVQVRVDAPQFDLLNEPLQELRILPDRDSPPVVFDLRPRAPGPTYISFDFFQNGQPLRTVSIGVEVTREQVAEGAAPQPAQPLRFDPHAPPPDRILHIAWDAVAHHLTFTLVQAGGAWWQTFAPVALTGDPAAHAAQLYGRITTLRDQAGRHLGSERELPRQDVDRQIRKLGQNLWEEVIPPDLKRLYGQDRDQWRDGSLLVFSDEPNLPWELVWPYDDAAGAWEDEGPWCQSLDLARWLRKDERGNGNEMAPTRLVLQALAVLAPTYRQLANLPFARQEREQILALAARHHVRRVGPAAPEDLPTWDGVLNFLEDGGYDWIHFAAHGSFRPETADGDSAVWLQEDRALSPQHLTGAAIVRHFRQHRPAFFFNACEVGRQGWTLTRISGWANRLVSAGAGLFVGPLWAVQDASAATFAETFYAALLDGATVAAATRQARLAALVPGDPTGLAYSVYGHPNARIVA